MQASYLNERDFLNKITEIVESNFSNEKFGVLELANEIGMSRSNLLRKIQKLTNLSVSQFIRQIRLERARELLQQSSYNVSEVAYQVGFSNLSYFSTCFKDYYGYPPGEAAKKNLENKNINKEKTSFIPANKIIIISISLVVVIVSFLVFINPFLVKKKELEKTIAVLPFINDSNDSTNIYLINGLMEAILNDLQKIKDLKVTSRTSVEKYRNTTKTISEIAKELNVNYLIEGSGQKIGDDIFLNIQLINAVNDKHIWAEQYKRETMDIFKLQTDIAKNIAKSIQVIITPEEEKRIIKIPTQNLEAYDYYLKGLNYYNKEGDENQQKAIDNFKEAIKLDPEYANAYANVAISYFNLDYFQTKKEYIDTVIMYADKALLLDPELDLSLTAKALSYMIIGKNNRALPYFEKTLEYNPNSVLAILYLSCYYSRYQPNTSKHLQTALTSLKVNINSQDSFLIRNSYYQACAALIYTGFLKKAEVYINKALEYAPGDMYTEFLKADILLLKNGKLNQTKDLIIKLYEEDTTHLYMMQETGKICFYLHEYEESYKYYKKFLKAKDVYQLNKLEAEFIKIGAVCSELGLTEESEELFDAFLQYSKEDNTIYKNFNLASYYSYIGEIEKAIKHLNLFLQEDNYYYWILFKLEADPLFDNIRELTEFRKIKRQIETKFWNNHKKIEASLKEKGLL